MEVRLTKMDHFCSAPLTLSRRPVLLNGEVELKHEDSVSMYLQDKRNQLFPPGLLVLTNCRLITIQHGSNGNINSVGWGINLQCITQIEDCASFFGKSTRIRLSLGASKQDIGLKFEKEGKDYIMSLLKNALDKKSWLNIAAVVTPAVPLSFSTSNAGVGGIIRRQEMSIQSADNISRSALIDLDALITGAKEAIAVIQRYASYHADTSQSEVGVVDEGNGTGAREVMEMETIMLSIGIVSPVTKFSAGRLYHEQLARQTADILLSHDRLQRLGGMITLTDLYCLLNRARGTVLVSPDDLLEAAELMGGLDVGVRLKTFSSGVKVLQLDTCRDDDVSRNIMLVFGDSNAGQGYGCIGVQASTVAKFLNLSLVIAKEQLGTAEKMGFVCRDDSINGLYYFPNLFPKYEAEIKQ